MKEKVKLRLYLLLMFVVVAVVSVVMTLLAVLYSENKNVFTYSPLAFVITSILTYRYLVEPITERMERKKLVLVAISIVIISITFFLSTKVIAGPNWSFTVSTNKPTYKLGEEVHITVSLENKGFIPHSFKLINDEPLYVGVRCQYPYLAGSMLPVWCTPFHEKYTDYYQEIQPSKNLEKLFLWNNTKNYSDQEIQLGTYKVGVYIARMTPPWASQTLRFTYHDTPFISWTIINITSNLHNPSLP
jgi:hypothetical protein